MPEYSQRPYKRFIVRYWFNVVKYFREIKLVGVLGIPASSGSLLVFIDKIIGNRDSFGCTFD